MMRFNQYRLQSQLMQGVAVICLLTIVALCAAAQVAMNEGVGAQEQRSNQPRRAYIFQREQPRSYLASGLGADGWTIFRPSEDTNIIYVSSSTGSDRNSGLNPDAPVRTLARAYMQLRHNRPDWMVLKRGDVWTNERLSNGRDGLWQKSGRSAGEPIVIGSYGDHPDRPIVKTGQESAFVTRGGAGSPQAVNHIAIVGIHLIAHTHDGRNSSPSGIALNWQTENLLIEDCRIERYEKNISISAPRGKRNRNIIVRRNVIVDAFHKTANAQGYWNGHRTHDVLIEENIVDNNGWKWPNTHKHNLYINGPYVVVRRNIITNGSSHGLQLRHNTPPTAGTNVRKRAIKNVFSRNSIALYVNGQGSDDPEAQVEVRGNVILDGKDITPQRPRGGAIDLSDVASGVVADNIIAHNTRSTGNQKILDLTPAGIGIHDTSIRDNVVWNWPGYIRMQGENSEKYSNISIKRNVIQNLGSNRRVLCISCRDTLRTAVTLAANNNFFNSGAAGRRASIAGIRCSISDWAENAGDETTISERITDYPDPDRTLATYAESLGFEPTHEAFVAAVRQQQKGSGVGKPAAYGAWDTRLTAEAVRTYIREGFAQSTSGVQSASMKPGD